MNYQTWSKLELMTDFLPIFPTNFNSQSFSRLENLTGGRRNIRNWAETRAVGIYKKESQASVSTSTLLMWHLHALGFLEHFAPNNFSELSYSRIYKQDGWMDLSFYWICNLTQSVTYNEKPNVVIVTQRNITKNSHKKRINHK